jgi:hypothetical protein
MSQTTFSGPVKSNNGFIGNVTGRLLQSSGSTTAATLTVSSTMAGTTQVLRRASGIAVTLPAATNTGNIFKFVIGITVTSGATTFKVTTATDVMQGQAYVISDGAAAVLGYVPDANDDTVTFNGTTTGGYIGDSVTLTDIAIGKYQVLVHSSATGTEATPFSATVS